jgi:hypothetical protein
MERPDWEAWEPQEPPRGFAERVVETARRSQPPPMRSRAARVFAGLLLAAAMAVVVVFGILRHRASARGAATADERQEVRVGTRALAVLEKGARVTWNGDDVQQSGGDVFWRVEPGVRFTVHTPAADVTVKGTCFRVKVSGEEEPMNARDARSGVVGAAIAATALVGVYEGKVAVSRAGQSVDLVAGQSAEAGPGGVKRVGGGGPDEEAQGAAASTASEGEKALAQANANLADSVRTYRRRLEALEAEKKKVEKELSQAQAQLTDGGVAKSDYDLSPQDWKELAKEGEMRARLPCANKEGQYGYSPKELNKLGLAPQDGPIIQQAFQTSHQRSWGVIQPLCSQALGGADVSKIGQTACVSILMQQAADQNGAQEEEDIRQVAEIMAGTRPPPASGSQPDPLLVALLALAHETQNMQNDLTQSLGPDDARRAVFTEMGCWWNTSHGVGPREPQ